MKKNILVIVLASLCLIFKANAQKPLQKHEMTGKVVSASSGEALAGAIIKIVSTNQNLISNNSGEFKLNLANGTHQLTVHYLSYKSRKIIVQIPAKGKLVIVLEQDEQALKEVEVISTGYQNIPKERATGSFTQIDNKLLNRSQSTDILSRINGVASGVIFTGNGNHQFKQSNIEIRGRATLFSNPNPLIILDNFPYDGDLSNINPNDVETISILKDAAAASAWGSRSGNGVIVITTKKGILNAAPTVNFNASLTVGKKPDLYYLPQLSSSEYLDVEQLLFKKGAYNSSINNGYAALSPAVEIFLARRNKTISVEDSLAKINGLKGYDIRQQLLKYYYRPTVNQQYQVGINGGGKAQKYFVSAGYDKNLNSVVKNSYDRITLNASNTYYFLNNKLELFTNIVFTSSKSKSVPGITALYPYDQLADANGTPIPVARTLRPAYATSAGGGKLLNWLYTPLDELNNGYSATTNNLTDYRVNLSLNYHVLKGLNAIALYSYEKGISEGNTLNELQSYYTRDLINTYSQINSETGAVTYPVPMGGVLNTSLNNLKSHNGRLQLNYDNSWNRHSINAIVGTEIKDLSNFNSRGSLYGYDSETATNQNSAVNYTADLPVFYNASSNGRISPNSEQLGTSDRFFSYYFNGAYTYSRKYIVSVSARKDESNLFGVSTNQKGVPLWSGGLAWAINNEPFYKIDWLPQLKVRATYGYTGNVNNTVSAYLTARGGYLFQLYNMYSTEIINPPNPSLRWERIKNINLGIDFGVKGGRINGSIDYWRKAGIDLIGNSPIAPQTGVTLYTGNSANTLTKGLDLQITAVNLDGALKWYTTLLYNKSTSKVTDYKVTNGSNYNVVAANYNNPLQGFPYYSIFSFKYAGLDNKGNPLGYLNGEKSTNYITIQDATNRDELVYHGSATPTSFGSLRNTWSYKGLELSFNIIYKFGYYFRRSSLDNELYSTGGNNYQMADYRDRWQKPGDELTTNVPALIYPLDASRNSIYTYSDILVEKGDHIRLQDIRIGYTVGKRRYQRFRNLSVFAYFNNIGLLWRANKHHIDPDYPRSTPSARSIALGIKADL